MNIGSTTWCIVLNAAFVCLCLVFFLPRVGQSSNIHRRKGLRLTVGFLGGALESASTEEDARFLARIYLHAKGTLAPARALLCTSGRRLFFVVGFLIFIYAVDYGYVSLARFAGRFLCSMWVSRNNRREGERRVVSLPMNPDGVWFTTVDIRLMFEVGWILTRIYSAKRTQRMIRTYI